MSNTEWMNEEEFGIYWGRYDPLKHVIFAVFFYNFGLSWRDTCLGARVVYMSSVVCSFYAFSLVPDCVSWPLREIQLLLRLNNRCYVFFVNRFSFPPTRRVCCVKSLRSPGFEITPKLRQLWRPRLSTCYTSAAKIRQQEWKAILLARC